MRVIVERGVARPRRVRRQCISRYIDLGLMYLVPYKDVPPVYDPMLYQAHFICGYTPAQARRLA